MGAGRFGIPLAHYLQKRHVAIKGIIDNKLHGKEIGGFNILSFDDICDETSFFITVLDSKINEKIEKQILTKYPFAKVVKYQDLCEEDI